MARVCVVDSGGGRGQRSRQEVGRPAEPVLKRQRRKCVCVDVLYTVMQARYDQDSDSGGSPLCLALCHLGGCSRVCLAFSGRQGSSDDPVEDWRSKSNKRIDEKQKGIDKREKVEGGDRESRGLAVGMLWVSFSLLPLFGRELVYKTQMRIIWDKMDDRGEGGWWTRS